MAQTVGQHGVAAFTNPSNGDPLDATVVKANDNSVRGAYVDHDSDGGIHLQSSALAARPIAGTAGRKWLTTDAGSVKLWFDTGAAWEEISYVPTTGNPTFTSATLAGTTTNSGEITGGTLSPAALNLPAGTVIGSATLSNATLSGTTTTSTINTTGNSTITGNLNVTGTVTAGSLSGPTTVAASNVTAGTFASGTFAFPGNLNVSGTLAPTVLTVPTGTTIPTHTETGTITATGSTRNGGTLASATLSGTTLSGTTTNSGTISGGTVSGATLNNSTFTGTVSGLNVNPTTTYSNTSSVSIGTGTTIRTITLSSSGTYYVLFTCNSYMQAASGRGDIYVDYTMSGTGMGTVTQRSGGQNSTATLLEIYSGVALASVVTTGGGTTVTVTATRYTTAVTASAEAPMLFAIKIS